MSIAEKLITIAENEQRVYEKGKQTEYDRFWDNYQSNGSRVSYNSGFRGKGWNSEIYKPKYPILSTDCECLFSSITKIPDTLVPIDTTANLNYAFNWATGFVTIRELTVTANVTYTNCFDGLDKLVNITFKGEIGRNISFSYSDKLSKASIQSIVSHLSDTETGRTLTLKTTAINNAFTGGSTGTEWLNLVATKSNWTISLS